MTDKHRNTITLSALERWKNVDLKDPSRRGGGGGATYLFFRWVCVSDDPKLGPIREQSLSTEERCVEGK